MLSNISVPRDYSRAVLRRPNPAARCRDRGCWEQEPGQHTGSLLQVTCYQIVASFRNRHRVVAATVAACNSSPAAGGVESRQVIPSQKVTGRSSPDCRVPPQARRSATLPDPPSVVGVLNACAEDVGEPGIDEEFGRGIVSVVCDVVQALTPHIGIQQIRGRVCILGYRAAHASPTPVGGRATLPVSKKLSLRENRLTGSIPAALGQRVAATPRRVFRRATGNGRRLERIARGNEIAGS